MTKIILVRHGQTAWTPVNRIQGWLDIKLNEQGLRQAKRIAKELKRKKLKAIYSSELSRAYETARIIARTHKLKVKKNINLNELNQGKWQGLLVKEAKDAYKKLYRRWEEEPLSVRPPGGESILDLYERALHVLREITKKYPKGRVIIVGHKVINAVIKCYSLGINLSNVWKMLPKEAIWEEIEVPQLKIKNRK
ncbi:histidine phosphatase family protein [bacterium]|nr:histidine phosphatase family protein [bacterium]